MLSLRHSELKKGLSEGIGHARRVLQAHRHPVLAGDVPHTFDDKYVLVEGLTGAGGLAVLRCLDLLLEGRLGEAGLQELLGKTVEVDTTATLVALSQTTCTFVREQKRTEDKRTIREYFWDVKYEYEFAVQRGGGEKEAFAAVVRRRSAEVLTRTKKAPFDTTERREVGAVDLTWLLRQLAGGVVTAGVAAKMDVRFHINREVETCRTACRNKDVADAKTFFAGLARFGAAVRDEMEEVLGVQGAAAHGSFDTNADDIVVPTVPLMVDVADDDGGSAGDSAGALLQRGELELLVQEQERALRRRVKKLGKVEHAGSLGSGKEAGVSLVVQQMSRVCRSYAESVVYVESLLRDQLVAAVGKAVSANDFAEYMSFHMRRRLQRAYAPRGLAVSVRHGNLNPEGSVVVQDKRFGCLPVPTFSRALGASVMRFDLNATTEATLEAQVNLHAFVDHQFGGSSGNVARHVQLRAEAQQFSAFVVLLGNVGGDDVFLPKHAVIVQNRDVFEIPLLLETIPSKKEFAKAVESLSPEQRAFAEAYRSMQMESTLFGMCVVQVKPHLERVLQLPAGSLTKEIQLTQDLLELFLVYNIRSDLLSQEDAAADGPDGVVLQTQADRVAQVKHHVDVVKQMLLKAKEEELAEAERRQLKRKREEEEQEEDERLERRLLRAKVLTNMRNSKVNREAYTGQLVRGSVLDASDKSVDVKMVTAQKDPFEVPKFRAKKVPAGPPSPPAPLLHSSTKLTKEEQRDWKIPPCIANWRSPKGYVIPLEKRLAAAGVPDGAEVHNVDAVPSLTRGLDASARVQRKQVEERRTFTQQREIAKKQDEVIKEMAKRAQEARALAAEERQAMSTAEREDERKREEIRHDKQQAFRYARQKQENRMARTGGNIEDRDEERDLNERTALNLGVGGRGQASDFCDQRLFNQDTTKGNGGNMARIAPDRRWFGASRVIGRDAIQNFREEMTEKLKDPYSVLVKTSKLQLDCDRDSGGGREVMPGALHCSVEDVGDTLVDTAGDVAKGTADTSLSISTFPDMLEQRLEAMGVDSVRPTIVKVGSSWNRTFQPGLLGSCEQAVLGEAEQTAGRAKAFGLLDSLTRCGLLPLSADMHVVVASTHSFGETLMDTLVQENVNPIAAVEASSLVVASALHETEPQQLLQNGV